MLMSDDEKLAKLKEDLKVAKQEIKDVGKSGTEDEMTEARANAKAIKVQIKKLQKEIEHKAKPTVDQAKIDELNARLQQHKDEFAEAEAKT